MVSLPEWPEITSVLREGRHELVLRDIKDGRRPNINDEELQKKAFAEGSILNFISITSCGLSSLGSSISRCTQLTRLAIIRNNLEQLPEVIGELTKLTFIDVSGNKLTSLPSSFSKLSKLETFIATGNELSNAGLFDFSSLVQLHILDLSHNKLTEVPSSLCSDKLINLHTVNLGSNTIKEVTDSFDCLEQMKDLNLSANQLVSIPGAVGRMEKIKFLDLSSNPFKDGRFKKLTNDKRAKVSAVLTYIAKNAPPRKEAPGAKEAEKEKEVEGAEDNVETTQTIEIRVGDPALSVKRLVSVKDVRPHLVCCVLRNLDLTGDNFKKFINIQTKLHSSSMCQNRTSATIGTHEMTSFEPPLQYLALPAEELHITALHKKTPVSAKELIEALVRDAELARKRTKRNTLNPLHRYLHLVQQLPQLPCLIDNTGLVISLPPVTNSDLTKMSEKTTSVWVEVSSSESMQICKEVMDALIAEAINICPKLTIDQVRVTADDDLLSVYPDKNDLTGVAMKKVAFESNA